MLSVGIAFLLPAQHLKNWRNYKQLEKEEKELILIGDTNCDFKN